MMVDAQRVGGKLIGEGCLTLLKCRKKKRIAVAGKHHFAAKGYGDDFHLLHRNRESVEHRKAYVLVVAGLHNLCYDTVTPHIMLPEGGYVCLAFCQHLMDDGGSFMGDTVLIGFGVVVVNVVNQALTVAYHPYFMTQTTVDGCARGHTFLWMCDELGEVHPILAVSVSEQCGDDVAALLHIGIGSKCLQSLADEEHCGPPIAHTGLHLLNGFACAAVNHSNEVIGRDDAVLARLGTFFAGQSTFYYCCFHMSVFCP